MSTENELTPTQVVTEPIVETPVVAEPVPTLTVETPIVETDETPEIFMSPESIVTKVGNFFSSWVVIIPSTIFLVVCLYYLFVK